MSIGRKIVDGLQQKMRGDKGWDARPYSIREVYQPDKSLIARFGSNCAIAEPAGTADWAMMEKLTVKLSSSYRLVRLLVKSTADDDDWFPTERLDK